MRSGEAAFLGRNLLRVIRPRAGFGPDLKLAAVTTLWISLSAAPLLAQGEERVESGDDLLRRAEQARRGSAPDPEKVLELLDQAALAYWLEGPTGPVAVRSPVNDGFRWAAGFHAEREEWQKALDTWRRWTPVTTCKNEWWVLLAERAGNIALCQAWLGGRDAAIPEPQVEAPGWGGGPYREAFYYLQCVDHLWRVDSPKERLRSWGRPRVPSVVLEPYGSPPPGEDWHPYRTALALLSAYDEGDPVRILAALDLEWDPVRMNDFEKERSVPSQAYIFAGRALASFGPPATNLVAKAIKEGNPRAFKVAGFTGREELVSALEARARTETEEIRKGLIDDALQHLRVEEAPVSGPASRPSGEAR